MIKNFIPHILSVAFFAVLSLAYFYPLLSGKVIVQSDKNNEINPIEEELKSFINSINSDANPIVDLKSAQSALQLAIDIAEQITMPQN